MDPVNKAKSAVQDNFNGSIAFSAAVGIAGLMGVAFLLKKSGIAPLQTAANVATKGAKK
ncbi:hypothetical protein [uncultured Microbulbifer sp.]|uniref:hypothetical protein n=1 Tax=uncultured Microbulbifer sp. TaxID=348147 RepID=UPI0025D59E5D|nr:hypothetical protein [uncultured Microbulbifer sp.]